MQASFLSKSACLPALSDYLLYNYLFNKLFITLFIKLLNYLLNNSKFIEKNQNASCDSRKCQTVNCRKNGDVFGPQRQQKSESGYPQDSSSLSVPPCSSLSSSLLDTFLHRARNDFGLFSAEGKTLQKIMKAQSNQWCLQSHQAVAGFVQFIIFKEENVYIL